MRENCTSGSARRVPGNRHSYRRGCLSVAIAKENIVPQAILFDIDETLTDRMPSIVRYAERFQRDFTAHVAPTEVSCIVAALLAANVRGYRPRAEVVRDFIQRLPWRTVPEFPMSPLDFSF